MKIMRVADLFNSCVFHPILIKFGLGANIGLKRTLNEFEMTMAIFLTDWTNQSKPTYSKSFYFYVFGTIWMKFGVWTANAPALLLLLPCSFAPGLLLVCSQPALGLPMVCSCPAPDPAHPCFAAFIIIGTLRLFSARQEPPFMVFLERK